MTEVAWNRLTAPELRRLAATDAIVLLPIGSIEQHGPHLPTGVDAFLAGEVSLRAARLTHDTRPVVVAPTIWSGLAEHHMAFGGTFTLSLSTLQALLHDLCRSVIRAGFSKILIVNGHGGNITALDALVNDLTATLSAQIAVTSYFTVGRESIKRTLDTQDWLMHACEGETSMIMELSPELVREEELKTAVGPEIRLQSEETNPVHVSRSFKVICPTGVAGDARGASPAKGKSILDACARELSVLLMSDIIWAEEHGRE
ncbi:creatininase family protein [Streptomyces sp. NPDC098781]|uniref:creatininase family protein n=1 Tax=Streptomyces sp. NPDC098781 TaxID=3366097 RepID=UPI003812EF86